jgi:uncharacterized protein YbjT (DUF2867 family)
MRVLVTGGTGVLGREMVRLLDGKAEVRVLSRRQSHRPGFVKGDLDTGEGLSAAADGVDVIAHCATTADYRRSQRDVDGTRRLLQAVRGGPPHVVFISIVGVDRIPLGYYRAKLATEQLIQDSGMPWTVLRTTQFHDLVLTFLMLLTKGPFTVTPRGFRSQPVDASEVAARMTSLVLGDPAGLVPDFGGPRVESSEETLRTYLRLTRRHRPVLPVPVPGRVAAAFRAGGNLVSDGERGTRTFEDYLRSRIHSDGSIEPPYHVNYVAHRALSRTQSHATRGRLTHFPSRLCFELLGV